MFYLCVCLCSITGRRGPCDGKTVRQWLQPDHDLSLRGSQPQLQKHVQAQTSAGEMAEWRRCNTVTAILLFITTDYSGLMWKVTEEQENVNQNVSIWRTKKYSYMIYYLNPRVKTSDILLNISISSKVILQVYIYCND